MNFDLYEFLKYHNGSKFYPVKVEEIDELEKKLNLIVPKELKDLLLGIGYGFIKGSENNVNRIMDTDSIRDFRLRKGDFEFYPDIEIYDEYEDGKLIFFEGSESALISIELTDDNKMQQVNVQTDPHEKIIGGPITRTSVAEFIAQLLLNPEQHIAESVAISSTK